MAGTTSMNPDEYLGILHKMDANLAETLATAHSLKSTILGIKEGGASLGAAADAGEEAGEQIVSNVTVAKNKLDEKVDKANQFVQRLQDSQEAHQKQFAAIPQVHAAF